MTRAGTGCAHTGSSRRGRNGRGKHTSNNADGREVGLIISRKPRRVGGGILHGPEGGGQTVLATTHSRLPPDARFLTPSRQARPSREPSSAREHPLAESAPTRNPLSWGGKGGRRAPQLENAQWALSGMGWRLDREPRTETWRSENLHAAADANHGGALSGCMLHSRPADIVRRRFLSLGLGSRRDVLRRPVAQHG